MATELAVSERREVAMRDGDSGDAFLGMLAAAARDPQVDIAKMRELLQMQKEIRAEQAKIAYSMCMKAAQMEMLPVVRDAENTHTRSKYARLETIDAKIKPIYTQHGFSLSFNSPSGDKDNVTVSCKVLHERGHSESHQLTGQLDLAGAQGKSNKTGIQGLGSTVTYLRRYLTLMAFNVTLTNEDNDGNAIAAYLDHEQHSNITDMIAECEMTPERKTQFLDYMKVKSVAEIIRDDYPKAMEALRAQLKKKKGGAA